MEELTLEAAERRIRAFRQDAKPTIENLAARLGPVDVAKLPVAVCPSCGTRRPVAPPAIAAAVVQGKISAEPAEGEEISLSCDRCTEQQAEDDSEAREQEVQLQRYRRRKNLRSLLLRAGCPPAYARFSRATWEASQGLWDKHPKYRHLVGWPSSAMMESGHQVLTIHGAYDLGKTGLATAVLGEAIVAGYSCRWEDTSTWLEELKARNFQNFDEVMQRVKDADVALFDDFGTGLGGKSVRDDGLDVKYMTLISRWRHMQCKPTLYTANVERLDELAQINGSLPRRLKSPIKIQMTRNGR